MRMIEIQENGLCLRFGVTGKGRLLLLAVTDTEQTVRAEEEMEEAVLAEYVPVEAVLTGENCPEDRLGNQMVHTSLGMRLVFREYEKIRKEEGSLYVFHLEDEEQGVNVRLYYQFYDGLRTFTCYTEVQNEGDEIQGLEAVSSFSLHGFDRPDTEPYEERYRLHLVHNGWQKELGWKSYRLSELGLTASQAAGRYNSSKIISITNTGAWSTKEYLPLGILEDRKEGSCLTWQIEHNGSWHWEIGEHAGMLYLKAAGPTQLYAHWYKELNTQDRFVSVPVSVSFTRGGADVAVRELTKYRRRIRRQNEDNEKMPVIFNDYMNCLWGRPTTEEELPLIDMAASCGCEYYCIDCGWYSAGEWWGNVGEWLPSEERFPCTPQFPEGLVSLLAYIRQKGMIPGLWLELEVMGLNCPLAKEKPDDWFFMRHGKRVREKTRYQLDYRNPEVRKFATDVIRRLVEEYGVGYIKMDYNIEPGIGTDRDADSPGDGLLEHSRAYLSWLDGIFARWPGLVIENCGSGGMRMDYAMLKRHSVQSTSDMEDYKMYATIAVNAPLALTPEQAAVWSYPLTPSDEEETIFNMVNVLLLRIHQSGHLFRLGEKSQALIREAISYYKETREDRKRALPFWPLGFSGYRDHWAALVMRGEKKSYLAVWRRGGEQETCELPLPEYQGRELTVRCAYPKAMDVSHTWDPKSGCLTVRYPEKVMARLYEIEPRSL